MNLSSVRSICTMKKYVILILVCGCLGAPSWTTLQTEHYTFHYRSGSVAEEDIHFIAEYQELSYAKIVETLQVSFDGHIHYYFYTSEWDKLFSTGDKGGGLSNTLKNEIHAIYNENRKVIGCHEDTHIIAYRTLGNPPFFLQEGLAVFMMESWFQRPVHEWGREFLDKGKLIPVKSLLISINFEKYDSKITYPQSGSFVKYLVDVYGIEKFKTLFSQAVNENIEFLFKEIYRKSVDDLEREWLNYLKNTEVFI